MENTTVFGTIAGLFGTCSMIPQIIKIIRTRNTQGISLYYWLGALIGTSCWVAHAIIVKDVQVMLTNGFFVCCNIFVSTAKLINMIKYKEK